MMTNEEHGRYLSGMSNKDLVAFAIDVLSRQNSHEEAQALDKRLMPMIAQLFEIAAKMNERLDNIQERVRELENNNGV